MWDTICLKLPLQMDAKTLHPTWIWEGCVHTSPSPTSTMPLCSYWGFLLCDRLLGQRQRDGGSFVRVALREPQALFGRPAGCDGPRPSPRRAPQPPGADEDGVSRQTCRRHGTDGAPRPVPAADRSHPHRLARRASRPPGSLTSWVGAGETEASPTSGLWGAACSEEPPPSQPAGGRPGPAHRPPPPSPPPPLPRGPPRHLSGAGAGAERGARSAAAAMAFEALAEAAERWCARTPFQLIAAEETERRMDFYAEPGVSFYVLCPEAACGDNFVSDRGGGRRGERC